MQAAAAEAKAKSATAVGGRSRSPASSRPRSRRSPSCSRLPATPACRRSSISHQGRRRLRDGARRSAGRRPRCARARRRRRSIGALNAASRCRTPPCLPASSRWRPMSRARRADAPPAPDRRRRRRGGSAAAAAAEAWPASGLGRGRPVALGRLRRRRAGVHRRRLAGWPSAAGSARWRARRPRRAARPRRRVPLPSDGRATPCARCRARSGACASSGARRRASWRRRATCYRHGAAGARDGSQDRGRHRRPQPTPRKRWPRRTCSFAETEETLQALAGTEGLEAELAAAQKETAALRSRVSRGPHRADHAGARASGAHGAAGGDRPRAASAGARARPAPTSRSRRLKERIAGAEAEIAKLAEIPPWSSSSARSS